jgi:hypothetical protein
MKTKIINWLHTERVDRYEKGTSQDMCPTNGDVVFFAAIMTLALAPFCIAPYLT